AARVRGLDRQAAGGEPVALSARNGAEVAGAEKGADLVTVVRPVDRVVHPEAGKPDVAPRRRLNLPQVEHVRAVVDGSRAAVRHLKDVDAVLEQTAAMEELDGKFSTVAPPQRPV